MPRCVTWAGQLQLRTSACGGNRSLRDRLSRCPGLGQLLRYALACPYLTLPLAYWQLDFGGKKAAPEKHADSSKGSRAGLGAIAPSSWGSLQRWAATPEARPPSWSASPCAPGACVEPSFLLPVCMPGHRSYWGLCKRIWEARKGQAPRVQEQDSGVLKPQFSGIVIRS